MAKSANRLLSLFRREDSGVGVLQSKHFLLELYEVRGFTSDQLDRECMIFWNTLLKRPIPSCS